MKPKFNELLALFLAALSSLLFQITITKIFEFTVWANYAYLVISTAMFGLGFSGVLLTRFPGLLNISPRKFSASCTALSGLSMLVALIAMRDIPIHLPDAPQGWPKEMLNVGIVFLALAGPFVFFGLVISYLLDKRAEQANIYYFADLLGAGIGCFLLVVMITPWTPSGIIFFCTVTTLAGAILFLMHEKNRAIMAGLAALCLAAAFLLPPRFAKSIHLKPHVDKRQYTYDLENGKIENSAYSALSRVDIAAFDAQRKRVWIAGGVNESNIRKFTGNFDRLRGDYSNQYIQAVTHCDVRILPHLSKRDHTVCMIGTSGGDDSHAALRYRAMKVTGVEMDPQIARFVTEVYKDYAGGLFTDGKHSELVVDEGRSFLRRDKRKFDVIQQVNNFTPIAFQNGALNLSETYLLTVESFKDFWDSLSDDGILSISRWGTYRLLTTAIEMLRREGMDRDAYSKHLVVCKGENWLKHTLLLKKSPWTEEEVAALKQFYHDVRSPTVKGHVKRQMDIRGILYAPYMTEQELPASGKNPYYKVVMADDPADFHQFGAYNFSPPTDNKPFFNHFKTLGMKDPGKYKGQKQAEFTASTKIIGRDKVGIYREDKLVALLPAEVREIEPPNLLDGRIAKGDLPPIIILFEALVLASLFFGLPLFSKREIRRQLKGNVRALGYFACLGLGFIFVELVLIQQLVKFLGQPVYSISAVIGTMLVTAGIGSLVAARMQATYANTRKILWISAVAILILSVAVPLVGELFLDASFPVRVLIAVLLVGAASFFMGMPMPTGIRLLREQGRNIIPWAWAINGYFTVIGSALSVLLALLFGFKFMFYLSAVIYFVAPFFLRKRVRPEFSTPAS